MFMLTCALRTPAAEQVHIPIDYAEAKQRLKWKSCNAPTTAEIPPLLENTLSTRKAAVALAQIYVGHTSNLHPVATYLGGTTGICTRSGIGAKNDDDH